MGADQDPEKARFDLEKILAKHPPEEQEFLLGLIDRDPLTGAFNRGRLYSDVKLVTTMSVRSGDGKGSSILFMDLDGFKKYNDTHGHDEGDRVLREFIACIRDRTRDYDRLHLYRYGGDEFVLLLPHTTTEQGVVVAERIKDCVRARCDMTVSIGISHYMESTEDIKKLISLADKAMYEAKKQGDRVAVYER